MTYLLCANEEARNELMLGIRKALPNDKITHHFLPEKIHREITILHITLVNLSVAYS